MRYSSLYLICDVYSRQIVAHEVHTKELSDHAAVLIEQAVRREGVAGQTLVIHQDNGRPMKGSTYLAKLYELNITPSYSRPGVSDDNAYAESLFRTAQYRPNYPGVFANLEAAQAWALRFVRWSLCAQGDNHDHKHRKRKFISPAERHVGVDRAIFRHRIAVYEKAQAKNPERWSRNTRNWSLPDAVWLNRPATEPAHIRSEAA
ncbi:MAG: transposase [Acidiferrobacter sp.]